MKDPKADKAYTCSSFSTIFKVPFFSPPEAYSPPNSVYTLMSGTPSIGFSWEATILSTHIEILDSTLNFLIMYDVWYSSEKT